MFIFPCVRKGGRSARYSDSLESYIASWWSILLSLRYFGSIFFSPEFDVQNLAASLSFTLNIISISKLSFFPTTTLKLLIETHGYLTHQYLSMIYSQTSEHLWKAAQEHLWRAERCHFCLNCHPVFSSWVAGTDPAHQHFYCRSPYLE